MSDSPASAEPIEHLEAEQRFVVQLPAGEGYLSYERRDDGALDLQHTVVPREERGRGVGERLVDAAMAHARATNARVVPTCPFVQAWLTEHPEARGLVAEG